MKDVFKDWRGFLNESKETTADIDVTEVAYNSMLAESVFDGAPLSEQGLNLTYIVSFSHNPNMKIVEKFKDSLYGGKRSGFLSYYSLEELSQMDLYLLEGRKAGFAIKDGNDIVSVHNNSSLKGLGSEFMKKAKESGGTKLDHFDGFLSGLYRRFGFTNVYEVYQWDENYKPSTWNYNKVDILDPSTSIYAEAFSELLFTDSGLSPQQALPDQPVEVNAESELDVTINPQLKYNYYLYGRPDVVMRKL